MMLREAGDFRAEGVHACSAIVLASFGQLNLKIFRFILTLRNTTFHFFKN
jgi:hypothetical protein